MSVSTNLLAVIIFALTAAVVVAIFLVLWRERTSARESRIAVVSGVVLACWAIVAACLLISPSLRRLLTPLALVPTFLVPLAFVLHVISLWQLLGGTWVPHPAASSGRSR